MKNLEKKYVKVEGKSSKDGSIIYLKVQDEEGYALTAQNILDAVSEYLLLSQDFDLHAHLFPDESDGNH